MALAGPSLGYMLATVPDLFPSCVPDDTKQLEIVKLLRLVSKDVGSAVMDTVTSCSLQLGEGACLKPEQLVQLMGSRPLKSVNVTVMMTSGRFLKSRWQVEFRCAIKVICGK